MVVVQGLKSCGLGELTRRSRYDGWLRSWNCLSRVKAVANMTGEDGNSQLDPRRATSNRAYHEGLRVELGQAQSVCKDTE